MTLKYKIIVLVVTITGITAGFWLSSIQQHSTNPAFTEENKTSQSPIQGTILTPARKIAIPALLKDDGSAFTLNDLTGKWHLFFFGYTHCPDICPTTMNVLAQAKKTAASGNDMFPQVFFISVDPERDNVDILSEYVKYFDKDFIGVTGDADSVKALALQMNIVYMKIATSQDNSDYTVGHSTALLLLNPEGKLAAFLSPPHNPETILKDIKKVISLQQKFINK